MGTSELMGRRGLMEGWGLTREGFNGEGGGKGGGLTALPQHTKPRATHTRAGRDNGALFPLPPSSHPQNPTGGVDIDIAIPPPPPPHPPNHAWL